MTVLEIRLAVSEAATKAPTVGASVKETAIGNAQLVNCKIRAGCHAPGVYPPPPPTTTTIRTNLSSSSLFTGFQISV